MIPAKTQGINVNIAEDTDIQTLQALIDSFGEIKLAENRILQITRAASGNINSSTGFINIYIKFTDSNKQLGIFVGQSGVSFGYNDGSSWTNYWTNH